MTTNQIRAIRLVGWIPVLVCLLLSFDPSLKESVDRPDVRTVATEKARVEANGDWCWSGGSDLEPEYVIFSRNGHVKVSNFQKHINGAIEQGVYGIDHGFDPYFVFCVTGDRMSVTG